MTSFKKINPEENIQKKVSKKYISFAAFGLIALTVIEIWASNTVIAYGDKFEKLSNLEKSLSMENQILENEIAKNSSLKVIASKSAELGFSSSISIQYIR